MNQVCHVFNLRLCLNLYLGLDKSVKLADLNITAMLVKEDEVPSLSKVKEIHFAYLTLVSCLLYLIFGFTSPFMISNSNSLFYFKKWLVNFRFIFDFQEFHCYFLNLKLSFLFSLCWDLHWPLLTELNWKIQQSLLNFTYSHL